MVLLESFEESSILIEVVNMIVGCLAGLHSRVVG